MDRRFAIAGILVLFAVAAVQANAPPPPFDKDYSITYATAVLTVFAAAFIVTTSLELLAAFAWARYTALRKKVEPATLMWYVLAANVISYPLFALFVLIFGVLGIGALIVAELAVIAIEAAIIKYFAKKATWKDTAVLSAVMNVTSAVLGFLILTMLFSRPALF